MLEFFKKNRGLLGMNARNLDYIRPYNRRKSMEIADSKLLCKRILQKNNLGVSTLIAKIKNYEELDAFDFRSLPDSFALKPNRGFGGEGIVVVYARKKNNPLVWIKANGSTITAEDLKNHIRNIIDGSFSLSNIPDVAFFEERLKLLKLFKPYAFKGIPDIRIIIFNNIPVMAMLRLPTRASDGKANLQQGAIGVGIDLATGTTTSAILGKGHIIEYVPGTRLALSGIKIPYWNNILRMAVDAQRVSGLGFLGADVAIDRDRGPVILELNARPGLSIQLANLSGLKERLKRISGLKIKTTERGVRVGKNLFGGEIEEEIEEISGKHVIGSIEKIKLVGKDGKEIEVEAKIDTGADSTSIDIELAKQLGFEDVLKKFEEKVAGRDVLTELSKEEREKLFSSIPDLADTLLIRSSHGISYRPAILISLTVDALTFPAKVSCIDRSHLAYPVIIGRKHLKKFLIDVNK
ncbi:MAG: sugar-transfer associated ATP-grasp domain-containing protein [Candidatus Moranbacteria bacterium]|nr:sugar-transfer associated ATP-grasp domain-containing protein [Candidatus Moranbacteria bacterium]MDD3964608.1 sugar-transfer associated ATP-grasp domain-containing protein [Candidatus Moranbacteria bacterium]